MPNLYICSNFFFFQKLLQTFTSCFEFVVFSWQYTLTFVVEYSIKARAQDMSC